MIKKLLSFSTLTAVILSGILATSCAPPPAPSHTASRPVTYVNKPRVTIRNNSYRNIVVGVRGPETRMISVPARSSRIVYLRSGVYKYAAAAKNTRTISGYKTFNANRRYNWNFGVN